MNRHPRHGRPAEHRTRLILAVITSVIAGATRAAATWLLDHLTTGG